jgi:phosphoglycolate phosphatase
VKRIDTIIFDMDGTLLNSLGDIADGVNYILKKYGYPPRTYDEIKSFVGNGNYADDNRRIKKYIVMR